MFEGRPLECRVARILGGDLAPRGVWPWDVQLRDGGPDSEPTRIEVKSGSTSFDISERNADHVLGAAAIDVWVFVHKTDGAVPADGLRYTVVREPDLAAFRSMTRNGRTPSAPRRTTTSTRLIEAFGTCAEDDLADAVRHARLAS